ncbi:hypothetical protein H4Q26_001163, partial [Puccinia striiformis f. sp. tritici PST-130]
QQIFSEQTLQAKGPLGDSSKTGFTSSSRDTPPAQDSPCASMKGKGKELTSTGNAIDTDDYDSDSPIASASTPSSSKIRPRPDVLSDAAKRMKK